MSKQPEYDSPEMDELVAGANLQQVSYGMRKMNATEEHLFRQWHSGYEFSTIGD